MLASRQPVSREERREWWRRQLARQQSANLSVTEFCRQLGVCTTTFYYWKNRVHEAQASTPVQAPGRRLAQAVTTAAANTTAPGFLPVSIIEPPGSDQLEIELTNACVVRFKGVIDPSLLQAAITAAGQLDGSRQGAD
jgi:hypothetical protein